MKARTLKLGGKPSNILQYIYIYLAGFFPGFLHISVRGGVTSAMGQAGKRQKIFFGLTNIVLKD